MSAPEPARTAFDLIEQARFARRMLDVVTVEVEKVIVAAQPLLAQQPVRRHLDVPTVSAEGWSEPVLYVIRGERAKGAKVNEIAETLERMFDLQVTSQVLLAAVLHFDLDRRVAVQGEPEVAPAVQDFVVAPVESPKPAAPAPGTTPAWAHEAIRLHDNGLTPGAIARRLKDQGASDYLVRCLVIPGFRDEMQAKVRRLRGQGEYAGEKKPAPAKAPAAPVALPPKPQPREPKTKPASKPVERKGVHILDLQSHSCRWPMGRGADGHETYCGCRQSEHGGSYCEDHAIKAHTPGCWPPRTPAQKRPTRMARSMSALPDSQPNQRRA